MSTSFLGAGQAPALRSSRKATSRLIGGLFLAGFLVYGVGAALVASVVGAPDFLASVAVQQTTLVLGAFLMLLNAVVDVGKAVLFFPIIETRGRRTALIYLATMIFEVVLLTVGVLAVLMIVPIAQQSVAAGETGAEWTQSLGALAVAGNAVAYQVAMMALGIGCIFVFALLFRIRLLPRFLSVWGMAGYAIFATGAIAEIFGIHIGLVLTIPGGLFEVALGFWLIIRGFEPKAYDQAS
ncbi:hypothetical protein ASG92_25480 [Arthrobacter sp. Soil736]|uniref:DUF4386 domain-containing protein n=1 Tax=Arthrobacter sp. Soil736 TaxID=1736395 RepID=UPI0006FA8099|nr:DUF4386 domain-containing protein [Arthrobacter sp. Soil736]KRE52402.1 hypothetical protein ASG92_25480 [Arthrobacter sp. Soil736]